MSFDDDWGTAARRFGARCAYGALAHGVVALVAFATSAACSDDEAAPEPLGRAGGGRAAPAGPASAAPGAGAPSAAASAGGGAAPVGAAPVGAGGLSPVGAAPGAGSGAAGAPGASAEAPGAAGTPLIPPEPPGEAPPPALPAIACPASATFCSGFETPSLPAGARFEANPSAALAFDATQSNSGRQSIVFRAVADGADVREVVAPVPGDTFWVRLYVRTDRAFGDGDRDSLFVASAVAGERDGAGDGVYFSERDGQLALDGSEPPTFAAGAGSPSGAGPTLAAGAWHCIEGFFDGPSGDAQLFAAGERLIDAPGSRPLSYQTFRFGYLQSPGGAPRSVWFDDVIVASERIGCE